jgi:hypothetical protein
MSRQALDGLGVVSHDHTPSAFPCGCCVPDVLPADTVLLAMVPHTISAGAEDLSLGGASLILVNGPHPDSRAALALPENRTQPSPGAPIHPDFSHRRNI